VSVEWALVLWRSWDACDEQNDVASSDDWRLALEVAQIARTSHGALPIARVIAQGQYRARLTETASTAPSRRSARIQITRLSKHTRETLNILSAMHPSVHGELWFSWILSLPALKQAREMEDREREGRALMNLPMKPPKPLDWPQGDRLELFRVLCAELLIAAAGSLRELRKPKKKSRIGRPPGSQILEGSNEAFDTFILKLFWAVERCGGSLSLDKNRGAGTLPAVLHILRPNFPDGFIPKALPYSRLSRLRALARKVSASAY
jgi:hypothetical protein